MAAGRRRWTPFERDLRASIGPLIAGVDEVGRGPLAGPVVACAVVMPPDERAIAGVDDSKRLSPRDRDRLATKIRERAVSVALGAASVREIDRVNIYHATVIAMRRALRRLSVSPHHVLVDGRPIRTLEAPHTAIVGGDARCYSIACASIVAKVTRDRIMHALGRRHPAYDWAHNVGYGTANHARGLESAGSCRHHRTAFLAGRRQFDLGLDESLEDDMTTLPVDASAGNSDASLPIEGIVDYAREIFGPPRQTDAPFPLADVLGPPTKGDLETSDPVM